MLDLSDRVTAITQQRELLEERFRTQAEAALAEQSRLQEQMEKRDAEHEAQISKVKAEQREFLRRQAEEFEYRKSLSDEDHEAWLSKSERKRKNFEVPLPSEVVMPYVETNAEANEDLSTDATETTGSTSEVRSNHRTTLKSKMRKAFGRLLGLSRRKDTVLQNNRFPRQ